MAGDTSCRGRAEPPSRTRAFTLVELLVVIAIIAVLLSLLLPVIARMRTSTDMVRCRNNLRQINQALFAYAANNNDHYPDRYTMGGAFFRRGPGQRNPADPYSQPEIYGLPALLSSQDYLPRNDFRVWICPSASDFMKAFGNTYVHGLLDTGLTSAKRAHLTSSRVFWVSDNTQNLPYVSGARRGPSGPNPLLPMSQVIWPHRYRYNPQIGTINVLYLDGHVGTVVYVPAKDGLHEAIFIDD